MGHGSTRLSIAGASTRIKTAARACADSNQALTGLPGTIDSVGSWSAAQVILLTGQTDAAENGLWRVRSGAWGRTPDLSTGKDAAGVSTFVSEGTSHGNKRWQCTNDTGDDVVGTDDLVWVAGASAYTHPTTPGNKHIPAAGASGEVLKYDSAGTAAWASSVPTYLEMCRETGGKKLNYYWGAAGHSSIAGGAGGMLLSSTVNENGDAFRLDSDGGGYYLEIDTNDVTNDDSYIGTTSYHVNRRPVSNLFWTMRFALPTVANCRFFAGLMPYGDRSSANNSDDEGDVKVGFQFSTGRGDTNFQFLHNDGSTQSLIDSGVAPATDVIYQVELEYSSDGMALRGRISDHSGSVLMADTTHTAASADYTNNKQIDLAPFIGEETLADAVAQFRFYRTEMWV